MGAKMYWMQTPPDDEDAAAGGEQWLNEVLAFPHSRPSQPCCPCSAACIDHDSRRLGPYSKRIVHIWSAMGCTDLNHVLRCRVLVPAYVLRACGQHTQKVYTAAHHAGQHAQTPQRAAFLNGAAGSALCHWGPHALRHPSHSPDTRHRRDTEAAATASPSTSS